MADKKKLENKKAIFIIGGPGCGKGTQCEKLVEKFKYQHLSSGDLLREACQSGSDRGKQLQKIMQEGKLVDLETVLDLLREAMCKSSDGQQYFLIDGYPRELEQGKRFEAEVCPCACVISFEVSEDIMVKRLLHRAQTSGRVDDNEETIKKRLRTFNESTKPVLDYYDKQNKVIHVDASGTVDDIFAKVCSELAAKLKA